MERSELSRYPYWSNRLVEEVANEFKVDLRRRPLSFSVGFHGAQLSVGEGRQELFRAEVEKRLIRKMRLGPNLSPTTPPSPAFVTGVGRVEMGRFRAWPRETFTAYAYTRIEDVSGRTVDVCLFGSMHNYTDWIRSVDQSVSGWISSSAPAIVALLESAGKENLEADDPLDYEPIAVDALQIASGQGIWTSEEAHRGLPESRGFTLGHADLARWCARIYVDVTLTEGRWHLEELGNPQRILIGAPLWVCTPSAGLVPYTRARRAPALEAVRERELEIEARNARLEPKVIAFGSGGAQSPHVLEPDPPPARRTGALHRKRHH